VTIRDIQPATEDDLAHALLLIQRAAYAVEAVLIHDDRIPPLHEHIDDLRKAQLRWLGAFDQDRLLGAIACEVIPGLWVTRYAYLGSTAPA
jgi:hypothetical protein